ncbi:MAG: hypothetical protein VYE22_27300 [Myxococcota bacterium]|nr:hypothetical protein [Myxococcota bacterium]
MTRPPRYAPKNRYRTRQSGDEVDAIDDNSATAIDRVIPDFEELERKYGKRGEPRPAPPRARWALWGSVVFFVFAVVISALVVFQVL